MSHAPPLKPLIPPPDEIRQAALNGDLVMFVGSGPSTNVGLPSWSSLAHRALEELRRLGLLTYSDISQLAILDPRTQLSIAQLLAREKKKSLRLDQYFRPLPAGGKFYSALNEIGCTCVTTNYDELLSPRPTHILDTSEQPKSPLRIADPAQFYSSLLDEPGNVIHLHGVANRKDTMIVTTKDYLMHYDREHVQEFLQYMFDRKTVVFLGYGLREAELLEHILRRGSATETKNFRRFALLGFFGTHYSLYDKLYRYYQESFGMRVLGFLRDHRDYGALSDIAEYWSRTLSVRRSPLAADVDVINQVLAGD